MEKKKSKLIIIEGPQGVGKTTITDHLRNIIPYTNLLRLSGPNDSSKEGLKKVVKYYDSILKFIESVENTGMNLLFDRTFFTEEVYCRLNMKDYSFTKYYNKYLKQLSKLDFNIYYINLYLSNVDNFKERLNREGKAKVSYAEFSIKSSIKQQDMYSHIFQEVCSYWDSIVAYNVSTDERDIKENLKYIENIINRELIHIG